MSVLKYFKNIPRSPPIGRQALSVIFFLQIRNEVPGKKKGHVAHPRGDSAHPRGDRGCRPLGGRQGPVAQPTGDRRWARPTGAAGGLSPPLPRATGVPTPIKGLTLSFPPHLSPKIPPKIQKKKRGVRRRKAAKPCRIQHL